jgi:hypothetical protein
MTVVAENLQEKIVEFGTEAFYQALVYGHSSPYLDIEGSGVFELVSESTDEGSGEIVFSHNTSFFRMSGAYDSYEGLNWDYMVLHEVTPIEKTITVYEVVES